MSNKEKTISSLTTFI